MDIILSIKPEYVNQIRIGNKKYEFRKMIFRNQSIQNVFIYETAPTKKIVGFFEYSGYIKNTPAKLWEQLKEYAGINECSYNSYFNNSDIGYAIVIQNMKFYKTMIDPFNSIKNFFPPQSYFYFDGRRIQ